MASIYSVEMLEHNSDVSQEFLAFIQGLLVPDPAQRLASKEAIFSHPFMQQDLAAVQLWEGAAAAADTESDDILLSSTGLDKNVYVKELLNLIELLQTEALEAGDDDDDDDEALTAD